LNIDYRPVDYENQLLTTMVMPYVDWYAAPSSAQFAAHIVASGQRAVFQVFYNDDQWVNS